VLFFVYRLAGVMGGVTLDEQAPSPDVELVDVFAS
jgi:hypothetical protein